MTKIILFFLDQRIGKWAGVPLKCPSMALSGKAEECDSLEPGASPSVPLYKREPPPYCAKTAALSSTSMWCWRSVSRTPGALPPRGGLSISVTLPQVRAVVSFIHFLWGSVSVGLKSSFHHMTMSSVEVSSTPSQSYTVWAVISFSLPSCLMSCQNRSKAGVPKHMTDQAPTTAGQDTLPHPLKNSLRNPTQICGKHQNFSSSQAHWHNICCQNPVPDTTGHSLRSCSNAPISQGWKCTRWDLCNISRWFWWYWLFVYLTILEQTVQMSKYSWEITKPQLESEYENAYEFSIKCTRWLCLLLHLGTTVL